MAENCRWNIVRGDLVQVIQGPQAGHKGKVLAVLRDKNRILIENVNMVMSFHAQVSIMTIDEIYYMTYCF